MRPSALDHPLYVPFRLQGRICVYYRMDGQKILGPCANREHIQSICSWVGRNSECNASDLKKRTTVVAKGSTAVLQVISSKGPGTASSGLDPDVKWFRFCTGNRKIPFARRGQIRKPLKTASSRRLPEVSYRRYLRNSAPRHARKQTGDVGGGGDHLPERASLSQSPIENFLGALPSAVMLLKPNLPDRLFARAGQ